MKFEIASKCTNHNTCHVDHEKYNRLPVVEKNGIMVREQVGNSYDPRV